MWGGPPWPQFDSRPRPSGTLGKPHIENCPPRPMGGEGMVGGAPLSSYLSASPKCGQECRTPPKSSPGTCRQADTSRGKLCGCVGGWVRNPDSSFLATPKGPNGVLHLPLTSGKGSSPGLLCGVGCATLIHLFWRHRKAGTGCCIPPAQKLVSKSGGWGAYPLFIFFCDTEGSRPGVAPPPSKAERRGLSRPGSRPCRTPEGRQVECGWGAQP